MATNDELPRGGPGHGARGEEAGVGVEIGEGAGAGLGGAGRDGGAPS